MSYVRNITTEVIKSEFPEEQILIDHYDHNSADYGTTGKGPQGMGLEIAAGLALPIVYKFLDRLIDNAVNDSADYIYVKIKNLLRNKNEKHGEIESLIESELVNLGLDLAKSEKTSKRITELLSSEMVD